MCSDGTPAMTQTDLALRDAAIRKALANLIAFYKHQSLLHPHRNHLPYEAERYWTLPILPRLQYRSNQGDPSFIFNTSHFLHGRRIGMIARMFDPKHAEYHLYGGAPRTGPRIDPLFTGPYPFRYNVVAALQFTIAIEVILGRPDLDDTLDKVSNSRGYTIANTRWADKSLQSRNRDNYKWGLREPTIPRNPFRHYGSNRQYQPIRPRSKKNYRGKWVKAKRRKPQQTLKRMAANYFTRRGRYTPDTGRQRRHLRTSKDVRTFLEYILTPEKERLVADTYSQYTSTTSKTHYTKPSRFRSR